jgi:hypothetical protein
MQVPTAAVTGTDAIRARVNELARTIRASRCGEHATVEIRISDVV